MKCFTYHQYLEGVGAIKDGCQGKTEEVTMEIKDILTRCDQLDEDLGPCVPEELLDVLYDELVLHDIAAMCTCTGMCV